MSLIRQHKSFDKDTINKIAEFIEYFDSALSNGISYKELNTIVRKYNELFNDLNKWEHGIYLYDNINDALEKVRNNGSIEISEDLNKVFREDFLS